jgi:cell surface protein SprA
VGTASQAYARAQGDPSNDNFRGYRDAMYDKQGAGILQRYKDINNPHGNSPVATSGDQFTNAFTLYPDQEELNRDNTLNEAEEYFQYVVDLTPATMRVGSNYITDVRQANVHLADGSYRQENWYLFRIPIDAYHFKKGNIPDFKSIRFIRMFLTGFEDTTVLRFGTLQLVRNQWRQFNYQVDTTGNLTPPPANDPTSVDVLAVNIEENDQRQPIPYRQPPGVERQQQISNNNVQLLLNEQSVSLKVCNLQKTKIKGVFRTFNQDLRSYGNMSMFIHAESSRQGGTDIRDGDMNAVVRIGTDFVSNYYEVRIPLKMTPWGATDSAIIWPSSNNLDFDLSRLTQLKIHRNASISATNQYFKEVDPDGRIYAIIGNPNLGEMRGILMGVENVKQETVCTEIWFDELRLSKLNEQGGYAALGRVDLKLADLGTVNLSGNVHSIGWGSLDQRVNERSKDNYAQFDASANLDFGRLLPKSTGLQIPVYASISRTVSTPKYDPYDLDITMKDKLQTLSGHAADSVRSNAIDQVTIKTITFTNVKKNKTNGKKLQPWDLANIDINYSYTHQQASNPIIQSDEVKKTRADVSYNYAPTPKFVEPFKHLFRSHSPWFSLIRDFNFNYKPSIISVRADVFRQFGATRNRNIGTSYELPEYYNKFFYFDRYYSLRWDLTRSLTFDFNAVNNARVDEPYGRIDSSWKKQTVRDNFLRGGRNTHYHQEASLSYTVPTAKLPLLDWTSIRASYKANYDWVTASLVDPGLGNTLTNGQTRNLTADLDFDRLYNKSRYLQSISTNTPFQRFKTVITRDSTGKKKTRVPGVSKPVNLLPRTLFRLLTSIKRIGIQYNEDMGTLLPGYLDSTRLLGMNLRTMNPGWKYILGYQPDTNAINEFGAKGLLTRDALFNALIQQRYNQHINVTAQVSPIRDLNIDITLDRTFDKQYSELYKDTGTGLRRFNPYATGSFSISYISYQTLFTKFDPNEVSETFHRFESNRTVLSQRLYNENPYKNGGQGPAGYYAGYGQYAQDVLIPAFIAAYTNKDPTSVQLVKNSNPNLSANPFSRLLPKPNWNITFNGLTRIPGLEKIFTNFTIRHGYNGTLSMNQFNTALLFTDPFRVGFPSFRDSITGNYVPYFLVPNVTISEQFSPLIAFDMTFVNQLSARFEYKKSRQLSLSLVDYQLAENRSTEYTIGMDWRKRGIPFLQNIRIGKNGKKLTNDVTFRLDYSLRDDATSNSKLDQNTAFGTGGQKVVRLAPSIDYVVNNRINLKFYFEQNKMIPKIATTAPVTSTRAGVQVRISLAQ